MRIAPTPIFEFRNDTANRTGTASVGILTTSEANVIERMFRIRAFATCFG